MATLSLKALLRETMLNRTVVRPIRNYVQQVRILRQWKKAGMPVPPPHVVKQRTVREYARRFSTKVLIETGTFKGQMIEATKHQFSRIFSIEIDPVLFEEAKKRFADAGNVEILQGDSGTIISSILDKLDEPCLFWLDAHYSGDGTGRGTKDTPIMDELQAVFGHRKMGHVVLVDDARCFNGSNGYPTLDQLKSYVVQQRPEWICDVKHDIIRIHPQMV